MGMTIDEAIKTYTSNAFYEKSDGNLQGYLEFKQLAEWLEQYQELKAQYEARLKADLEAILVDLKLEIEELRAKKHFQYKHGQEHGLNDALELIQQKINELKAESEDKET